MASTESAESASPHGRRRPRQGDLQEKALLDATERLLQADSPTRLTIGDIAAAAGLSRSAFYFYFDSKESILTATAHRVVGPLLERQRELYRDGFVAGAEAAIDHTFELWREHTGLLCAMAELASSNATFRELWSGYMERNVDMLEEALTRDRERGRVSLPEGELRAVLLSLMWLVERNCFMLFSREHDEAEEQQARAAALTVFRRTLGFDGAAGG
ncbi:TetR/AcrR family transcriptional regulator [Saccharopolyspora griseoalba]|uniref:TetR/AcrR family transcriptional regulator n=1 Tax=Saccharopolyspora griseoalba TaxID=1431848 RepID=A0ABW2LQJ4_9PSEU